MQCAPFAYSTYRPWFDGEFERIYAPIAARTKVTPDRAYVLRELCLRSLHLDGAMAECGVYQGGTAYLLADTIARHATRPVQLHLFDTFAGMPKSADDDPSAHREGDFGDTSLAGVQAYLAGFPAVAFHPGFIPDTFGGHERERFAFVHVDVDLYSSVRDCCAFFYPRLVPGGTMVFDDYGFPHYVDAARKAVDEFFADTPERPLVLGTGQCLVQKL
jgi:O-methyltransferase